MGGSIGKVMLVNVEALYIECLKEEEQAKEIALGHTISQGRT